MEKKNLQPLPEAWRRRVRSASYEKRIVRRGEPAGFLWRVVRGRPTISVVLQPDCVIVIRYTEPGDEVCDRFYFADVDRLYQRECAKLLDEACGDTFTDGDAWMAPHVADSPHGEVVLEWRRGGRKVTAFLRPDGEIDVLRVARVGGPGSDEGVQVPGIDFSAAWRWLCGGGE